MSQLFTEEKLPYICTPLTGATTEELLAEVQAVLPKKPDLLEWRADFFLNIENKEAVLETSRQLRHASGEIPILFTIRSVKEGGEHIPLDESGKVELLGEMCKSDFVQMVDYEVCNEPELVRQVRDCSAKHGKKLILSYHNFKRTPHKMEICKYLLQAELYGADAAKAAVMPENQEDVFTLLEATREMQKTMGIPVITISMGGLGAVSRLFGWMYGSVLTFAVGEHSSAPGQIPIEELRQAIQTVKQYSSL
ncbi:type I 3-dehydroquinate dehydratase [Ectobacillus ponti]|uniref:3-dehydroquinate dehydratase n=1 Tax=Ectobacillus ponti TaxID=2961894 RepID=A0AA41X560_9BACI|nr:type I 3-dehydroquinate dehydratase [Ectobacillus ponti]MCP8967383.1 type I 3-dehydroquinate dehydratase [Ectobacillus ponti]